MMPHYKNTAFQAPASALRIQARPSDPQAADAASQLRRVMLSVLCYVLFTEIWGVGRQPRSGEGCTRVDCPTSMY